MHYITYTNSYAKMESTFIFMVNLKEKCFSFIDSTRYKFINAVEPVSNLIGKGKNRDIKLLNAVNKKGF